MMNPDREAFLYEYFEEYHPIDSLDFEDAVDSLMEGYPSLDQNRIDAICLISGEIHGDSIFFFCTAKELQSDIIAEYSEEIL